jgi:phosphosulfolactate synthase (CoM biosynthesis protein A)
MVWDGSGAVVPVACVYRDADRLGGMTISEADVRRFSVDEFEQLVEALGLERVELIDGVIYNVSPELPAHVDAVKGTGD